MRDTMRRWVRAALQRGTAAFYADRPIDTWPAAMGWLHQVKVPRGVTPAEAPQSRASANINCILRLLDLSSDLPGDTAECGVHTGETLIPMGIFLQQQRSHKRLLGFDSFEGFPASVQRDLAFGGMHAEWKRPGAMGDTSIDLVSGKARRFKLANVELVKGFFQETLPLYADWSFSFVHLDVDMYDSYRKCLEFFYPRLDSGGILLFDEYNDPAWPGCNRAVGEFLVGKPETLRRIDLDNYEKYYLVKS